MVNEIKYTNISRVLDNLTEHPMLTDLTLEQVIRHTVRFIGKFGMPKFYEDKDTTIDIHEFRGLLPCDLIRIIQVKDTCSGICLRSMTDSFTPARHCHAEGKPYMPYILPMAPGYGEPSFKTQGRVIFTSFPEGRIEIAYKAIPVDEDGFPLLIDNENYLACLEAYIKERVFTVKYDQGKIAAGVLENAKRDYAYLAGELQSEFTIPSVSEMESISRYITSVLPSVRHFDRGFRKLGNREYIRNH